MQVIGTNKIRSLEGCWFTEECAFIKPFAPGDFAEKHLLKLVEWFSGHRRAVES